MAVSRRSKLSAVSLIETLIYIAVVSIFLMSVVNLTTFLLQVRNRNQVVDEVNQQGVQTMQIITRILKNTSSVTAPALGVTAGAATLTTYTTALNPTVFDLNSGRIRITENGAATFITSNRVTASNLSFQNLGGAGTKGTIRVRFTLTHVNPDNKGELRYSQTFYASITIR